MDNYKLTVLRDHLIRAENERAQAMANLKNAIFVARDSGMSITEIAKLSGVTRQTVYTTLKSR